MPDQVRPLLGKPRTRIQTARRDGTTSAQMRDAPPGAVYVWPNHRLGYPNALAHHIKRTDLRIIGPEDVPRVAGGQLVTLVYDHAAAMPR